MTEIFSHWGSAKWNMDQSNLDNQSKNEFQNKWSFGAFIASSKWHFLLILMYCESDANTILYCTYLLHTTCKQMIQFYVQKMYWANTTCKYQICIRLHILGYLLPKYLYFVIANMQHLHYDIKLHFKRYYIISNQKHWFHPILNH